MTQPDNRRDTIKRNLEQVRQRIAEAEQHAGRPAGSVTLVPVTKFHPVDDIMILGELGVDLVGENREQEARGKVEDLARAGMRVSIAMIGQIQSKKANAVARWASEVHSVDSVKLANGLDRGVALAIERGDRLDATLPCMVQVSDDGDTARGGVPYDGLDEVVETIETSEHLTLAGLMVVPPLDTDPVAVFTRARERADALAERTGHVMALSAGMSGDFEQAIACGSDIVRVGTGVLGRRPVG